MQLFGLKNLFYKKPHNDGPRVDQKDLITFYHMLLKMQKKRTYLKVNTLMKLLYGSNFRDFLHDNDTI